jgi:hypothetical protein
MKEVQIPQVKPSELDDNVMYLVMKLLQYITVTSSLTNKNEDIKLNDCAGYLPVFKTLKEAEKYAGNGKYKILAISEE